MQDKKNTFAKDLLAKVEEIKNNKINSYLLVATFAFLLGVITTPKQ